MTDHTAGQREPSAPSRGSVANHDARLAALEELSALDQKLELEYGLTGNPMIKAQEHMRSQNCCYCEKPHGKSFPLTQETNEPSAASAGSGSHVPAWADDLGREIACYLYGISVLRHGLTMPGDFIPCVAAALRAGFASGQIRLPENTQQVPRK